MTKALLLPLILLLSTAATAQDHSLIAPSSWIAGIPVPVIVDYPGNENNTVWVTARSPLGDVFSFQVHLDENGRGVGYYTGSTMYGTHSFSLAGVYASTVLVPDLP